MPLEILFSVPADYNFAEQKHYVAGFIQDYSWGNLTKLGVANYMRRMGYNMRASTEYSNKLPANLGFDVAHFIKRNPIP